MNYFYNEIMNTIPFFNSIKRCGIVGSYVDFFLTFKETASYITLPPAISLHRHYTSDYLRVDYSHPSEYEVLSHCDLDFNFPDGK